LIFWRETFYSSSLSNNRIRTGFSIHSVVAGSWRGSQAKPSQADSTLVAVASAEERIPKFTQSDVLIHTEKVDDSRARAKGARGRAIILVSQPLDFQEYKTHLILPLQWIMASLCFKIANFRFLSLTHGAT
jgi:hypothetical protein